MVDEDRRERRLVFLREFQSKRLRDSYLDFIEIPKYQGTCEFFFGRVYRSDDPTERDREFERFYHRLKIVFAGDIERCMKNMIELQRISVDLDLAMLPVLTQIGVDIEFDMTQYEEAYRLCDNYDDRKHQIDLLVSTLRLAHHLYHLPGIGVALKTLNRVHKWMGNAMTTEFLLDGFYQIRPVSDIDPLAKAIEVRETERLDRIYHHRVGATSRSLS